MPHPDALPRASEALLPPEKVVGYALNTAHESGSHKARVFARALGFSADNADELVRAIRDGLPQFPAIKRRFDKYGQRYQVDVPVTGPVGTAIVRTAWIIRTPAGAPSLTSMYVKESS